MVVLDGKDISICFCVILLGNMTPFVKNTFKESFNKNFLTFFCFTLSKKYKRDDFPFIAYSFKGGGLGL